MTPTEKQIYDEEGEKLQPYKDHLGWWTIGVGHLIDNRKGGGISLAASRFIFAEDVASKKRELLQRFPWMGTIEEPRFAAFLNMAFQMGVDGLAGFVNTLSYARAGNWEKCAANALLSKWATADTPARAKRVCEQLRTGQWQWKK